MQSDATVSDPRAAAPEPAAVEAPSTAEAPVAETPVESPPAEPASAAETFPEDSPPASGPVGTVTVVEQEDVPVEPQPDYGPFWEAEPPSDATFATDPRKGRQTPVLSVGDGAFCFVNGSWCKASLILTASTGVGMRIPASDEGPDIPYAQFAFRGGLVVRPLMFGRRRDWHPWGLGMIASWSRGTGSITLDGEDGNRDTPRTDAFRIAAFNQIWLSKKKHGIHLDLTIGGVQSEILTSGRTLWGTHAEVAFGWGGWGSLFAAADFLDRDTRVYFGLRGHGIAAGPIIAMALAGLAAGGAL